MVCILLKNSFHDPLSLLQIKPIRKKNPSCLNCIIIIHGGHFYIYYLLLWYVSIFITNYIIDKKYINFKNKFVKENTLSFGIFKIISDMKISKFIDYSTNMSWICLYITLIKSIYIILKILWIY
jgi:hypothetical protein